VISQTNTGWFETRSTPSTGFVQSLGTGLNSTFGTVRLYSTAADTFYNSTDFFVQVFRCSTPDFTICSNLGANYQDRWQSSTSALATSSPSYYTFAFDAPSITLAQSANFVSASYYYLALRSVGTGQSYTFGGSATASSYPNGACYINSVSGTSTVCSTLADLYFVFSETAFQTSYTSNLSPANGSTTAGTTVNFQFDYHAGANQNITTYSALVRDLTANESFTLDGSASTGDNSVARSAELVSGHLYSWVAYVCSSGGTCYGGPVAQFSVVTDFSTNDTLVLAGAPYVSGSTTTPTDLLSSFSLVDYFLQKFPINWIVDLTVVVFELQESTTTTDLPSMEVDFGYLNTLTAIAATSTMDTNVVFMASTTFQRVADIPAMGYAREMVAGMLWFGLVMFGIREGRRIFSAQASA